MNVPRDNITCLVVVVVLLAQSLVCSGSDTFFFQYDKRGGEFRRAVKLDLSEAESATIAAVHAKADEELRLFIKREAIQGVETTYAHESVLVVVSRGLGDSQNVLFAVSVEGDPLTAVRFPLESEKLRRSFRELLLKNLLQAVASSAKGKGTEE